MYNIDKQQVNIFELVIFLTNAVDHIIPGFSNKQQRIVYIAYKIAKQFNLTEKQKMHVAMSGLLHDIGIILSREKNIEQSDFKRKCAAKWADILEQFIPLSEVSEIVRHSNTHGISANSKK